MARETIKCPHCECKVLLSEVEKEEGLCPECGQMLVASTLFDDYEDTLDDMKTEHFSTELQAWVDALNPVYTLENFNLSAAQ